MFEPAAVESGLVAVAVAVDIDVARVQPHTSANNPTAVAVFIAVRLADAHGVALRVSWLPRSSTLIAELAWCAVLLCRLCFEQCTRALRQRS